MSSFVTVADTNQIADRVTSAATYTESIDLGNSPRVDVAVDVSGSATLTVEFSTTGEFSGEEFSVTVDYDSADEVIEQFDVAHQFVRAKVDSNLTALELIKRGV
jgi:hypothetical protein